LFEARPDLAAWRAARPTEIIVDQPRIGVATEFFEPDLCAWLIERAQPLQTPARIYDFVSGLPRPDPGRSNTEATFTLAELNLPLLLLRARIANTIGVAMEQLERTSVFRYRVGQRFAPHADYLDPASSQLAAEIAESGQRTMTFLVYLNNEFEGGETRFTSLDKALRGGVGGAVFFSNVDGSGAPDERTWHEGAPPTSGEKWLLSQFIRDKPQRPG